LNGTVIKSHGGASAAGFANALGVAAREVGKNIPERISQRLARLCEQAAGEKDQLTKSDNTHD
jgi:glycerol-3-phosphate acyltransferase PlsX